MPACSCCAPRRQSSFFVRQVEAGERTADGRDVDAHTFLLLQEGLQLGQRDVVLGAHLATYQLMLSRTQTRPSAAAMWSRRKFAGGALEREHLFNKADADAEPLGDFGNRVAALFAGVDRTLA